MATKSGTSQERARGANLPQTTSFCSSKSSLGFTVWGRTPRNGTSSTGRRDVRVSPKAALLETAVLVVAFVSGLN